MHQETKNQRRWRDDAIHAETELVARKVVHAAYRVHRALGAGFKESVYHQCLAHALQRDGLAFRRDPPLNVEFEGLFIQDAGEPDLIVESRVIVELKASDGYHPAHGAQVINYLKASGLEIGLLINFQVPLIRDGIKRFLHPELQVRPEGFASSFLGAGQPNDVNQERS